MNIKQNLLQQFKQPTGFLGRIAGQIMAHRRSNIERNRWMLETMQLKPADRILEIGYGPGLAVEGAVRKIEDGMVMGIDHSEVMLKQASRRIAPAIAQGKAQLLVGDIEARPEFDIKFNHIYSANVVMFWRDPVKVFQHLKGLLLPKGDVTTLYLPRHGGATSADSLKKGEEIRQWLEQAGFDHVEQQLKEFDGLAAVCVIGINK